jgi:hypothetical protein
MPLAWLNNLPADAEAAGTAAAYIRGLKSDLNTDCEHFLEIIGAQLECVMGWPRIFCPDDAAALAALTPSGEGCLAFQVDTLTLYRWTGAAWQRVAPAAACYDIPLPIGVPRSMATIAYFEMAPVFFYTGPSYASHAWIAGAGYDFNLAEHAGTATIKLHVTYGGDHLGVASTGNIKLYDVAAAADVVGSTLALSATHETTTAISGDLRANIAAGARKFRLKLEVTAEDLYIAAAALRITVT